MQDEETLDFAESRERLDGVDWNDDSLFFTYSWTDETSQFDNHPSVRFNGDYYSRTYSVRMPLAFKGCEELCERFLEMIIDSYPGLEGFYLD